MNDSDHSKATFGLLWHLLTIQNSKFIQSELLYNKEWQRTALAILKIFTSSNNFPLSGSGFDWFANNSINEDNKWSEGDKKGEGAKEAGPRKLDIFRKIFKKFISACSWKVQLCSFLIATKKTMRRVRATRKRAKLKKSDQSQTWYLSQKNVTKYLLNFWIKPRQAQKKEHIKHHNLSRRKRKSQGDWFCNTQLLWQRRKVEEKRKKCRPVTGPHFLRTVMLRAPVEAHKKIVW